MPTLPLAVAPTDRTGSQTPESLSFEARPTGEDDPLFDLDIELDLRGFGVSNDEEVTAMAEREAQQRAGRTQRRGLRPSTQAAGYVREEMHHRRSRKHGPMTRKQAIAVGLSRARKAGISLPPKRPTRR